MMTRLSEQIHFPTSCGFTKRIVRTHLAPIKNTTIPTNNTLTEMSANTTSLVLTPNPDGDETFGSLPYGLVLAKKEGAVNAEKMARLSSNLILVNATESGHISVLFNEMEARLTIEVVKKIWDKITK